MQPPSNTWDPDHADVEHLTFNLADMSHNVVVEDYSDAEDSKQPRLTRSEEDEQLKHTTAGFADWVTTFIRRVIVLMENLPDEKDSERSSRSGATTESD